MVESLPVSEDIKKQKGDWRAHIENYRISLRNVAAAGIEVVCYNFMPVLDWTRTDLAYRVPTAAPACASISPTSPPSTSTSWPGRARPRTIPTSCATRRRARFAAMDDARRRQLARNVAFGLPGSAESLTLDGVRAHLDEYGAISAETLRGAFRRFPRGGGADVAEEVGIRLCCHPDDPPFSLLGLPRIMSTEADYAAAMAAVDEPGERHDPLLGLARRAAGQRPARA